MAAIVAMLEELKGLIERTELKTREFRSMKAIWFGQHPYQPLLYVQDKIVEISSFPLNHGERAFVEGMKSFHDNDGGFFDGKELCICCELRARDAASTFSRPATSTSTSS